MNIILMAMIEGSQVSHQLKKIKTPTTSHIKITFN
jgi:hypothetical protein